MSDVRVEFCATFSPDVCSFVTLITLTQHSHSHAAHCTHISVKFSEVRFSSVSFLFYLCGRPSYFMLLYIEHILMLHNMPAARMGQCGVEVEVRDVCETAAG